MADDGFDGGAPAHLAADGLADTPDLAADPDLEPVRIVVAAIALAAVDAADTCKPFALVASAAAAWPLAARAQQAATTSTKHSRLIFGLVPP